MKNWYTSLKNIAKIKAALLDEESRQLFDARINYMIDRNEDAYIKVIEKLAQKWICSELEKYTDKEKENMIVFGCGRDGKTIKHTLDICNHPPKFWCDSDKEKIGSYIDGLPVLSLKEVLQSCTDSLIIIGSRIYAKEMRRMLLDEGISEDRILQPKRGIFTAHCGKQYFDVFRAGKEEVYIDAGAFNGDTIIEFLIWSNYNYKKIFALEPQEEMYQFVKEKCRKENLENVIVENAAAWNQNEFLDFTEDNAGSRIEEKGKEKVSGRTIDDIVGSEKVTFIKMDIEGSERKALEGAKNIICRDKPRLAICIYHKPYDVIEIPEYILELEPNYKFKIRHYASNMFETVIYAAVE